MFQTELFDAVMQSKIYADAYNMPALYEEFSKNAIGKIEDIINYKR